MNKWIIFLKNTRLYRLILVGTVNLGMIVKNGECLHLVKMLLL